MTFELNKEGRGVNRKRVRRLMRVMGIEALVPRPGTSKAAPGQNRYPYLLRGLKIVEPNHVWAADVTYIPMVACGFLYLVAIIDWASRAVLWRLSKNRLLRPRACFGSPISNDQLHFTPAHNLMNLSILLTSPKPTSNSPLRHPVPLNQ